MSKNIIVLSDGTGQEGGTGHDTNIYKLFRMLEDRTQRQIVFYEQGLGTDACRVTGNAFGAGFSKNVLRDNDETTLKALIDSGLENSERGVFDNLLERVISHRRKTSRNRYDYDRGRWYGSK